MSLYTNTIVREPPYTYSRFGFQVEVQNTRGCTVSHLRADDKQLFPLLTYVPPTGPALTQKGTVRKHQPKPYQDQPLDYYQAQLLHYGLKSCSSIPAAKKALLAKYNHDTKELDVSIAVRDIKQRLKKQYKVQEKIDMEKERVRYEAAEVERKKEELKRKREKENLVASFLASSAKKPKAGTKAVKLLASDVVGHYEVICPTLKTQWSCEDPTLSVHLSNTGKHLWVRFYLETIEGVCRSEGCANLRKAVPSDIKFHWRGRENGNGESTYNEENIGSLQFERLDDGTVVFSGTLFWDCWGKEMGIFGRKQNGNKKRLDSLLSLKTDYRKLNEKNYRREETSRWGGWGEREDSDESATDYSDSDMETTSKKRRKQDSESTLVNSDSEEQIWAL